MFRRRAGRIEVFLVHPGGPLFAKKDAGFWGIPKGELQEGENPLAAAKREFEEETGMRPSGEFIPLGSIVQKSGKKVLAWAFEADFDPAGLRSNTFRMEWPPGSGIMREFPEIDRAQWFGLDEAREKINPGQIGLLDELKRRVESALSSGA